MFIWDVQPEVFSFSPLPRWYGLCFAFGFGVAFFMVRSMLVREQKPLTWLDPLLTYVVLGTVIGMRLGHTLFYQPEVYLRDPIRILKIWEGGFASHGGFLGVLVALALFARGREGASFLWLADRLAVPAMFMAGCIRIGNFFNSEMIGRPTDRAWGVVFASVDAVPRHPAQLYEATGYFCIFIGGWLFYRRTRLVERPGRLLGVILVLGFGWRMFCELFKVEQVAFEQGMQLNMGQILSLPYLLVAVLLLLGVQDRLGCSRSLQKHFN